jgi:heptosyltransferase-2
LLINANASELSYSRRWHIENFAKTAKHFADLGYTILFLGSPDEKEYVQKAMIYIENNYRTTDNIYNAAGIFTIKEIPALFDICDVLLTNDAGLMNLGYAQGIKTVALYGANTPSFVHIDNGRNTAIYKKAYCSPCLYLFDIPPCGNLAICIESITVEEVIQAVEKTLSNTNSIYNNKEDYIVVNKEQDYIMGTLRKR